MTTLWSSARRLSGVVLTTQWSSAHHLSEAVLVWHQTQKRLTQGLPCSARSCYNIRQSLKDYGVDVLCEQVCNHARCHTILDDNDTECLHLLELFHSHVVELGMLSNRLSHVTADGNARLVVLVYRSRSLLRHV